MNIQSERGCLNCARTEAQIPLLVWRYQGRELWICPDCLPILIHQREQLMAKWPSANKSADPDKGG
jgi:hypothetical protein